MSLAPDRDKYRNASYAPAMLGISPYMNREELLNGCKYGIWPAVTPQTQRIFAKGHENEALARPIAEALVGHPLPPKRFTRGNLGATLDGYYLDAASLDSVNWECKTLNDAIRAVFPDKDFTQDAEYDRGIVLPEYLRAQMEQQLICSEADKCLFTARNDDECAHCWYYPDPIMRQRIIDGWAQFEKDLAAMPDVMPAKAIEGQLMPVVRSFPQLPAIRFGIVGGVLADVLRFESEGRDFVATINQKLVTDQDFADGKNDEKDLENCVKMLDTLIDSPQDLAAFKRVRKMFNDARIVLTNQLSAQKEAAKAGFVKNTQVLFERHAASLLLPEYISSSINFTPVVKGLSSIASMQNALSAALLKAQSEATAQAVKIRANLALIAAAGNDLLFTDKPTLVHRLPEDVQNAIKVRLAEHAAKVAADAEKARLAALPIVEQVFDPEPSITDSDRQIMGVILAHAIPGVEVRPITAPGKTLNITQINERLKFVTVTAVQLVALGFPGVEGPRKGSSVWPESDYLRITAAIKANI